MALHGYQQIKEAYFGGSGSQSVYLEHTTTVQRRRELYLQTRSIYIAIYKRRKR